MPSGKYKRTQQYKDKMSRIRKGAHFSPKTEFKKGHKMVETTKKKIRDTLKGKKPKNFDSFFRKRHIFKKGHKLNCGKPRMDIRGNKNPFWKGGITPINNQIRSSLEYKIWQDSVLNLGFNCCQKCGEVRISLLVAHHIQNFAQYPELRFAIDNGIIFCRPCHRLFHHIYGKKNNNLEQINIFTQRKTGQK